MGRHHRVTLLFLLAGACACRRSKPNAVNPPPLASIPPDRLAPGEAAPGQMKAHDLFLPRGGRIDRTFGSSVYAYVPLPAEAVANYIRTQTDDTESLIGPTGTVFPKLRARGAAPDHWLRVEINAVGASDTNVIVDRIEDKPPPPANKTNAELMKEVGLTPDGKLLDPKRIE